jgi:hypothetical protein
VQGDGRGGPAGPGGSEGQLHGRSSRVGAAGRTLRLLSPSKGEPAACQQFEAVRPPAAGDKRQLLTTAVAEQQRSTACAGCPVSSRAAASLTAAQAVTKPSPRSRVSSTASSAVASAMSRSPTASATTERLKRFPARAGDPHVLSPASGVPRVRGVASPDQGRPDPGPGEAQRLRARPFFLFVAHEPKPLRPTQCPVELALCPCISER